MSEKAKTRRIGHGSVRDDYVLRVQAAKPRELVQGLIIVDKNQLYTKKIVSILSIFVDKNLFCGYNTYKGE